MTPCHVVEITTLKKFLLRGIWLGPTKPKRVIVWVHGLGSSMFSKLEIAQRLVDKNTAVLVFNNRGHDKVVHVSHASGKFGRAIRGGAAHEKFTDSVDDIQGAINFARKQGGKTIFLAGHSTGCQKSIYWANKKGHGVKGIILLAPMSDYDAIRLQYDKKKLAQVLSVARSYIRRGKARELLPPALWYWPWIADAQRFVSLYGGKGPEEIFTYWDEKKRPRTLESVRIPILILLAQKEEYTSLPAKEIAWWFERHTQKGSVAVVPGVGHSFRGGESRVVREIRQWMNGL